MKFANVIFGLQLSCALGFTPTKVSLLSSSLQMSQSNTEDSSTSRREALQSILIGTSVAVTSSPMEAGAINLNPLTPLDQVSNGGNFQPSKRATAYLVDSTIPPTLVPFRASREAAILKSLGSGSGTPKSPYIEESLNLNNMMNKGVFGTIELVQSVVGGNDGEDDSKKKASFDASFVFMGVDYNEPEDAELAVGIMTDVLKPRRGMDSALALEFVPLSMQSTLDRFIGSSMTTEELIDELTKDNSISRDTLMNQVPILKFAKSKQLPLIACSPEAIDVQTVRAEGLQNVNPENRAKYVIDAEGFIAWTQDPKNRMYTEKSLLKDFKPISDRDAPGNFFAEKILRHEAMASAIAKYTTSPEHIKNNPLILAIAPIADVRYLGGPNGRLPRVCKTIKNDLKVDEEAVTTILLNPSAEETLSKSKYMRLEIGTKPDLLQYQTKVADYLWFSSMPKVNSLPRLMNGS